MVTAAASLLHKRRRARQCQVCPVARFKYVSRRPAVPCLTLRRLCSNLSNAPLFASPPPSDAQTIVFGQNSTTPYSSISAVSRSQPFWPHLGESCLCLLNRLGLFNAVPQVAMASAELQPLAR